MSRTVSTILSQDQLATLARKLNGSTHDADSLARLLGDTTPVDCQKDPGAISASIEANTITCVLGSAETLDTAHFWPHFSLGGEPILTHYGWEYLLADHSAPASQLKPGLAMAAAFAPDDCLLVAIVKI